MFNNTPFFLDIDISKRIFGDFFRENENALRLCPNSVIVKNINSKYHLEHLIEKNKNGFILTLYYDEFWYYTNIKHDIKKCGYIITETFNDTYLTISAFRNRIPLKNIIKNEDFLFLTVKRGETINSNINFATLNKGDIVYVDKLYKSTKGIYDVLTINKRKLKNVSFKKDKKYCMGIFLEGEIPSNAIIKREYLIEIIC